MKSKILYIVAMCVLCGPTETYSFDIIGAERFNDSRSGNQRQNSPVPLCCGIQWQIISSPEPAGLAKPGAIESTASMCLPLGGYHCPCRKFASHVKCGFALLQFLDLPF